MITIHPADGLIKRLLQQNPRQESSASSDVIPMRSRQAAVGDPSPRTPGRETDDPAIQQHASERDLESKLLQLYRANVRSREES
ncbi:MAG TPA: hypothetical protein VNI58_09580 [Mariprofundaceae bacterium]|nr:hypothetical protein [Mariprofundaceae bacterium]